MAKILVIEDDKKLAEGIVDTLLANEHTVEHVENAEDALQLINSFDYDLLILDWNLPAMDGLELLKKARKSGKRLPILFLTGKSGIEDIEKALDSGADDFLPKPFHTRELLARVRTLLRRPCDLLMDTVKIGHLTLELGSKCAIVENEKVRLTANEFRVLEFLFRNQDRHFSARGLLNAVWSDKDCSEETVRAVIFTLRKKLNVPGQPELLKTDKGAGYKLGG